MKTFTSSPDRIATTVPYLLILIALVPLILGIFKHQELEKSPAILIAFATGPAIVITLNIYMFLYRTLSINIDTDNIIINRKLKPVTISLSGIKSIREISDSEMKNTIRTFGNGGLWGYTGWFYNRNLGKMLWYCTQRKNYILIEKTDNKKIVISPDKPDELIQFIRLLAPQLSGNI